jgi:CBS-domain-containing membrane protein
LLGAAAPDGRTVGDLIRRPPKVVYDDNTLRDAADHMVNHDIGRLPVMARAEPSKLVGILTRADVLGAHRRRLDEAHRPQKGIDLKAVGGGWRPWRRTRSVAVDAEREGGA